MPDTTSCLRRKNWYGGALREELKPSHADELLTRSLKTALALVDINVLDHFIVAQGHQKMGQMGLLQLFTTDVNGASAP